MTSSYFSTPYSYPTNVQVHNPVSIYPVGALNEIQNHTIVVPSVSGRKLCRGVWLKLCLLVSIVFHLIFVGLITWTLLTFYKTQQTEVWTKPVFEKGQPNFLSQKLQQTNSSSVICITRKCVSCQREVIRVLFGKNEFFCRNIELSLELLAKEILTAGKFLKKRKFSFNSYYVDLNLSKDKHDFGTLPLIKVNDIYEQLKTTIVIGNPGWFRIIVDLTIQAGRNVCTKRTKNFVRVTCEDQYLGRRTLLQKDWSCSPEIHVEERLIQPMELGEIFKLSNGSIIYVEVLNRTHLYKDVKSNYVGLVEI
ncbi:uncharacterized protein LOC134266139 [Saccostrea cucullata]|uniref:uncharacterized protein LOC134266139 n=1 Tax=Saccostrea cuccullata TaxID=36930 RepID=UPI002ED188E9